MCDTMANVPSEDGPSYVLTEDMIDAAMMTEQFSYQDDIESGDESQEENIVIDQSPEEDPRNQISISVDAASVPGPNQISTVSTEPTSLNSTTSVVVIETGLNSFQSGAASNESMDSEVVQDAENVATSDNSFNSNQISRDSSKPTLEEATDPPQSPEKASVESSEDSPQRLPILKKILSDDTEIGHIDSIDLCDSDESSTDGATGVGLIDNELESVMENNLMAEIGIAITKQLNMDTNKQNYSMNKPKIAVKKITQITPEYYQNSSQTNHPNVVSPSDLNSTVTENAIPTNNLSGIVAKEQLQNAIHINKIAVPHQTIVNSKGQKMKCVYVRHPTTAVPVVINSTQSNVNNRNIKYVVATPQAKKLPMQMQPQPVARQTSQKQVTTAPKTLQTSSKQPTTLQNTFKKLKASLDQDQGTLTKSLLLHNLKRPYSPPNVDGATTYPCVDCNDRFLLQSSLCQHLKRCSMLVNYWCRICKTEYRFYNRCVFLQHLRAHNISIKHIDTTCIQITPITKDMATKGIFSSSFADCPSELPQEECILRSSKEKSNNKNVIKPDQNTLYCAVARTGVTMNNLANSKTTSVVGQSRNILIQSPTPIVNSKPICSNAASTPLLAKKALPPLLAKSPKFSILKTVQSCKEPVISSPVNNVNRATSYTIPNPSYKQNTPLQIPKYSPLNNTIPPNVPYQLAPQVPMEINDDQSENITSNVQEEDEEVDVENVIAENSLSSSGPCLDNEKDSKTVRRNVPQVLDKKQNAAASKSLRRSCSECGNQCLNITRHLNGTNRPLNNSLACEMCEVIMPTKCALSIHHRIHNKTPPYKCPDCGKDFELYDELYSHVKYSCGHLAKCMRYMCVSCKGHFPTSNALGLHISSNHARDIFKCSCCPVAFFSKQSLDQHMASKHPNAFLRGMDYKQCSLCPKKLVPSDKFINHINEHATNSNARIYGFKCPMCSIVFANKTAFIIHQIKERGETEGKSDSRINKGKTKLQYKNNGSSENLAHSFIRAPDPNSDIEEEPEIIRTYPEDVTPVAEKDPLSLEDWEYNLEQQVEEKREELCIVCKKNSVTLLPGIDLNEQSLCCKQCVKPLDGVNPTIPNGKLQINNRSYPSNSTKSANPKRKQPNPPKPKPVQRSSSCDNAKPAPKKRRISEVTQFMSSPENGQLLDPNVVTTTPKRKIRKKPNKEKQVFDQSHIQGQVITSNSPNELVCSKCEFVSETREIFLEHITVHRSDPNSFQCLECGLCFVVLPSLERHLQIHHGIKDVIGYIENNKTSLPQKRASKDVDMVHENQCRVCFEEFDCLASLEKHFRTHGMAFMSSLSKSP